ncbi:M67 family metallopeptidase [Verrucomicrobiota bacterium]
MKLEIEAGVFDQMLQASRNAFPLEACGLLAGSDARATRLYSLTNADASPVHYSMIAEEQFAAIRDIRKLGLRLLAIWHSHPAKPARMSPEDLRLAYTPDVVYAVLSLVADAPSLRCFVVEDAAAEEIQVTVTNSRPALERSV